MKQNSLLGLLTVMMVLLLAAWPTTLAKIKEMFPKASLIMPGHGDPGGWELLENTMKLIKENSKKF